MIVDALRPIAENLGLRAGATSTPQPGLDHYPVTFAIPGVASSLQHMYDC